MTGFTGLLQALNCQVHTDGPGNFASLLVGPPPDLPEFSDEK